MLDQICSKWPNDLDLHGVPQEDGDLFWGDGGLILLNLGFEWNLVHIEWRGDGGGGGGAKRKAVKWGNSITSSSYVEKINE